MICKWCGAKVEPGKKTCGRCGRQHSPLSDCGGFYDVVPDAPRAEQTVAPDVDVQSIPVPVFRSTKAPGWMKITLGVLAAGVVLLGVLSLGQMGKIRELEGREKAPVMGEHSPDATESGEPETTMATQPVQTEPVTEEPTEPLPPLGEDLTNRLEDTDAVSDFVKKQLQRMEDWNIHAKQADGDKTGPWFEGMLRENLESTLENTLGNILKQEESPTVEEEPTEPVDAEVETTEAVA